MSLAVPPCEAVTTSVLYVRCMGGTALRRLQRDAPAGAVFDEDAAVDLALADAAFLVAGVDDVGGAGGLLEDADLELAGAREVVGEGFGDGLEGLVVFGVVDLDGAGVGKGMDVSVSFVSSLSLSLSLHLIHTGGGCALHHSLLAKVERKGKVLPGGAVDGRRPQLAVLAAHDLERVLG